MYTALYARQSIDRDNSVSIETQLEYCKGALRPDEQQYGVRCFSDRGYSGKNTERPDFQRLMKEVRRGRVRKIIVYKLDRISRSIVDFVDMLRDFRRYNVSFSSSQEGFDTGSAYGEMICKILMVFAEFERESIVNRVRDAFEKRSDMGLYTGGRQVYGYRLCETVIHGIKTKYLVPEEKEAEQVRYIFDAYSQPSVTLRTLQAELLANNIVPLRGADWTTGKLGSMLRNPVYARADADIYSYFEQKGTRIVGGLESFSGRHNVQLYGRTVHDASLDDWSDMKIVLLASEGLVDSETWLKCQHKLEQNRQIGNSLSNRTSWLSGKLVCSLCGHTMTTVRSGSRRYFMCSGRTNKKTCKGIEPTIYVSDMEDMMDGYISEKLKNIRGKNKGRSAEDTARLNELKLKLKSAEQKLDSVAEAVMNSGAVPELISVLNEKALKLTEEKRHYLSAIEVLERASSAETTDLSKKWDKADFAEKRSVCSILVKAVSLYENGDAEIIWNI